MAYFHRVFPPKPFMNFSSFLFIHCLQQKDRWYNSPLYRNRMQVHRRNLTGVAYDSQAGSCENSNKISSSINEGISWSGEEITTSVGVCSRLAGQSYLMDSCTHIALSTGNMTLKFSMTCSRVSAHSTTSAVTVTRTVTEFSVTSTEYIL